MERVAQPTRLQALFEGAALGAPQLGGEGLTAEQPASAGSQDEHAWARDFDLFGPGPATVEMYGDKRLVDDSVHSGSVEARVTQLTNMVQELAKIVTTSVASPSAQPLEGAASGAPAASSSQDALESAGNPTYREKLNLRTLCPRYDCPQVQQSEVQVKSLQGRHPVPLVVHHPVKMMTDRHVACVVAASTMRKTALRVPQVVVRGVAEAVVVQVLRGVPGMTLESVRQSPRTHQQK